MKKLIIILLAFMAVACGEKPVENAHVKLTTTMGDVTVRLSDLTPGHRDNFLQLTEEGYFDGLLFHRVIGDFMIQGGDPRTRNIKGSEFDVNSEESGNPRYWEQIPAEIHFPQLYHRRGALAAAREGDFVNPERKSSRTQFYIVWGRTFDAQQLERMEQHLTAQGIELPPHVREAYMNEGGTPHLDGQYTVFGEVTEGLEIVEKIQGVMTDDLDRPLEDVRIIKAERVK